MATKNTMSDRNLVSKGTSSDDTPTPGFVLKELVNSTWGGQQKCKDIVGLLIPRLKKSDPNIKLKTLKIINYLIINGRVEFQREMRPYHQLVKDCQTFTGPLDPLKGDSAYVAIQSTAKETIDNLFNETLLNRSDAARPVDSFASGAAASASSGMTGIGGGSRAPPAPKDDWLNRAKGTFGGNPMQPAQPAQPAQPMQFAQPAQPVQPAQPQMTGRYGAPQPTQPVQPIQPTQPVQPVQPAQPSGSSFFNRNKAPAPAVAPAPVYTPPVIKAGSAVSDGSYERKLVEELCTPQGMRPEPPKDKLTKFTVACQTLDPAVVGPILLSKLSDKNWKVVMKALATIKEVLKSSNTDGFKAYFKENTEEIQLLGSYNHPLVKKEAGIVYDKITRCNLGEEGEEAEEESHEVYQAPVVTAPANDFDFFGAAPAPAPAPARQPTSAPAPAPVNDDPFSFNAATAVNDAFASFAPAPAAAPAPVNDDPFSMNLSGTSDLNAAFSGLAPAPKPQNAFATAPKSASKPAASFLDMYSAPAQQPMNYGMSAPAPAQQPMNYGMSAPAPAPTQQQQNFDFFGF